MKKIVLGFLHRGIFACCLGPIILAILYLILHKCNIIDTLTVNEICTGIFSLTLLAFIAGGMNVIYKIEKLPLMVAILIHGVVLYISYLFTYLINDWIELGTVPIMVFTGIFIIGYLTIWIIIYSIIKKNTVKLNAKLKEKQKR